MHERWYHSYLFLMFATSVMAFLTALASDWTTTPVVIVFGMMFFMSLAATLAEFLVMGFSALTGGFFLTCVTCYLVMTNLPLPTHG